MNNEQLRAENTPPFTKWENIDQAALTPEGENDTTKTHSPPGWKEYSEAALGPDGKKRNENGDVVDYPHHLS